MKRTAILIAATAVFACLPAPPAAEASVVGIVKSVSGEAFIIRQEKALPARTNSTVWKGDVLKTGSPGSIGLIFEDDTVISMGPSGEFVIDDFAFEPADRKLSFVGRMVRGTLSYLSGQIAKLAPGKVRLETPDATIGMRGTRVLIQVD